MKRLIFLLFLITSLASYGQVQTKGFNHYTTGVTGGTAVDTSFEAIAYNTFTVVDYDVTRPNKVETLTGDTSFEMDGVGVGQSGSFKAIFTTTLTLTLNGLINFTMPTTPGTYIFRYSNIGGTVNWNYP